VFRMLKLAAWLFVRVSDVMALAVDRWMAEIENWIAIAFHDDDDRETRNHNPWGDAGFVDPVAFEQ